MTTESKPYGAQLLAEFRKVHRLDLITGKLDYDTIQLLKQADRAATLKLFQGSSYAFLQLLKTKDAAEVVQALLEAEQANGAAAAAMLLGVMITPQ